MQVQSPVGEDDEVFTGNVSLDEGLLDADDDVKVGGSVANEVSVLKFQFGVKVMLKVTVEETLESMDTMDASNTETITLIRNKSSGDIYSMVRLSDCLSLTCFISGAR